MNTPEPFPDSAPRDVIATVRYSLPRMLAELKQERITGTLAMEKIHQTEITNLFKGQPKRRRAKVE